MAISTERPAVITSFHDFIKNEDGTSYKPATLPGISDFLKYIAFYEKYSKDPQISIHNEQVPQILYNSSDCIAFYKLIGGEKILNIIFLFNDHNIYIGISKHTFGEPNIQVLLTYNLIDKELVLPNPKPSDLSGNTLRDFEVALEHTRELIQNHTEVYEVVIKIYITIY